MTFIHAPVWVEGQPGEHMVAMRSHDQGRTWTDFVAIEPYSNTTTAQVRHRARYRREGIASVE